MEAAVSASQRSVVDGRGTRGQVRAWLDRGAACGEDQVSDAFASTDEEALAADQLPWRRVGDLRAGMRISGGTGELRRCGRGFYRRGRTISEFQCDSCGTGQV